MTDILLHKKTKKMLQRFISSGNHALLVAAPDGAGKGLTAQYVAAALLGIDIADAGSHQFIYSVQPEDTGTISIDAIRELQKAVKLSTTGAGTVRRVLIVEHADGMTLEAQNAFLKLLEEPPTDTVIIVTVANTQHLLPTIRSRLQVIELIMPDKEELTNYFGNSSDAAKAYSLSGGMPGLMHALLDDTIEHPLTKAVESAKELLSSPLTDRLMLAAELSAKKDAANQVAAALTRIAQAGLEQATAKNDAKSLTRWQRVLSASNKASESLGQHANTKLVLTDLALNM